MDGGFSLDLAILLISFISLFHPLRVTDIWYASEWSILDYIQLWDNFYTVSSLCPYTSSWFRGGKLLFGKYLFPEGL